MVVWSLAQPIFNTAPAASNNDAVEMGEDLKMVKVNPKIIVLLC